jgi:hypothetical protein
LQYVPRLEPFYKVEENICFPTAIVYLLIFTFVGFPGMNLYHAAEEEDDNADDARLPAEGLPDRGTSGCMHLKSKIMKI